MDFDNPPRNARVLTIIEAADGTAWVVFYPDTTAVAVDRRFGSLPNDYALKLTTDGVGHMVVARSVEEAMRTAADYWAQPHPRRAGQINNMKGLTQ